MTFSLTLGNDDLLRCRFAISPLWETHYALRVLREPHRHPALASWCRDAATRVEGHDLTLLQAVMPDRGYTPDFISAPGHAVTPTIDDQLVRVRATPADIVADELARAARWQAADADPALHSLCADPLRARDQLADQLELAWRQLVEPDWVEIHDVLAADIAFRSRWLTQRGLEGVLDDMHPAVHWIAPSITVHAPIHASVQLDGRGLVMQPSAFTGPGPVVILDEPWQPTLVYPARGTATLARSAGAPPAAEPLFRLLGPTRARLFLDLTDPVSTTVLARRYGMAPSTISAHVTALRDAGLITGTRQGHSIIYAHTPLGTALIDRSTATLR